MINKILKYLRLKCFQYKFRKMNSHNTAYAMSYFPRDSANIGKNTYGPIECIWMTNQDANINIGNYCSIGPDVKFLVGGA